ncbi:hypothetical protein QQS21_004472 [Conoideocrella luteorostrata]|uniref:OPT oligopeptide transporter n=1 Tax=Conoideocrella luteorostrata TaxID=1105319 RepID=A0AAJ0CUA7_9HYPO|nr:hypothetical protein QQS21_004472 [Conoideocrella luteorostrata]
MSSASDEQMPEVANTETTVSEKPVMVTTVTNASSAVDATAPEDASSASEASEASHQIVSDLQKFIKDNEMDLNFPQDLVDRARQFIQDRHNAVIDVEAAQTLISDIKEQKELAQNHSAYAEVRAVVDATDDPAEAVATFRCLFMGTLFCVLGSAVTQFFALRMPSISVSTYVVQLVSMPLGVLMAKYLPGYTFGKDKWWAFSLNPCEFTQKEHLLIAIMANVSFSGAFVNHLIQVLKLNQFYGEKTLSNSIPWQICTLLATQLMGYGCAGMTRRFLVYPPAMIWQRPLANIALTKALHQDHGQDAKDTVNGWTMSRYRFFVICFCGMFVYFWIPNYLFESLALFNWTTWISPGSVVLAIVTGSTCGLGLNPLPTLDWNIAAYLNDPIVTPLFTLVNFALGMAFAGFVIAPILYFNNVWNGAHLPINTNKIFDNTGNVYNIHRILTPQMTLDVQAYKKYSIPWLSTTQLINHVALFTMYASIPTYVFLYYRKDIVAGFNFLGCKRQGKGLFTDKLNILMSAYDECPHWWYLVVLAFSFALACISVTVWPTGTPVWSVFVALLFTLLLQIPIGMLWAITNIEIPTSILAIVLGGYVLEGKAIPNMLFKMFSYSTTMQSLGFVADLKLAHYAKIPPRWAFAAQMYATAIAGIVSLGVNHWVLRNIPDLCSDNQRERFTCPFAYTYFKQSVVWGVIGPGRLFGPGGPYAELTYVVPFGAILPVIVYWGHKRWPTSWLRNVNVPIFMAGPMCWSPYNWSYMQGSIVLGLFFNGFVKRRYRQWWERYAYVLTSSFMAAIGLSGLVMFFTLQKWNIRLEWWGNQVSKMGVDQGGLLDELGKKVQCVYKPLRPEETFNTGL